MKVERWYVRWVAGLATVVSLVWVAVAVLIATHPQSGCARDSEGPLQLATALTGATAAALAFGLTFTSLRLRWATAALLTCFVVAAVAVAVVAACPKSNP